MGFVSSKPRELCQMMLQEDAHTGVDAGDWETVFTCLYPFTVQTRPLAGTASGMASDSVRSRGGCW